jgi:WD40 repeat protein
MLASPAAAWYGWPGCCLLARAPAAGHRPDRPPRRTFGGHVGQPGGAREGHGGIHLSVLAGRIAFSAGPPHREDVYVINADGTGRARVTTDPAADFDSSWSPDGSRIAYRHQPGGDPSTDIYAINTDGSLGRGT